MGVIVGVAEGVIKVGVGLAVTVGVMDALDVAKCVGEGAGVSVLTGLVLF